MNGFIRGLGKGVLAAAVMTLTGCCTLGSNCDAPACDAGKCDKPCNTGCKQSGCPSCGSDKLAKIRQQIEDFDYEQLHSDHCWPSQYTRESIRRVNAAFGQQMVNGTEFEQTLWTHYFRTEKGKEHELNEAGIARLKYLARKKPYVIPQLSLQTSFNQDLDGKRINAVLEAAKLASFEPVAWNVAVVHREAPGLFGPEGPKSITKMVGPGGGPPAYEPQIKQGFLTSGGGARSR